MIQAFIATVFIAAILILSEILWRGLHIRGEFARKFVHVIAGTYIAFLPFWMSYPWIIVLAVGFIAANILNRYTPLFHAIHAITRKSWGDLLFGVGILFSAILRPNKWIFAGAILQVALADGMAAIIGTHYGKHKYKIFDHVKTPIGTLTFYIFSLAVLVAVLSTATLQDIYSNAQLVLIVPLLMTLLENVSGYGTDNIVLPMVFIAVLNVLKL